MNISNILEQIAKVAALGMMKLEVMEIRIHPVDSEEVFGPMGSTLSMGINLLGLQFPIVADPDCPLGKVYIVEQEASRKAREQRIRELLKESGYPEDFLEDPRGPRIW